MSDTPSERRRFKRIAFDAQTELSQGPYHWPVKLIDLSLKGLLIERPDPWLGEADQPFEVTVKLAPQVNVLMTVQLAHDHNGQLGFQCVHISLESISYLRRLVELNLGDQAELERELGALIEL